VIPDLVIGGRPVSRAEIEAAPSLDASTFVATGGAGPSRNRLGETPIEERDAYAADLISRGVPPARAVAQAQRTAVASSRTARK
jgi:hypothetical protein